MTSFRKKVLTYALAGTMAVSAATVSFAAESDATKFDTIVGYNIIQGEGNGVSGSKIVSRYRAFMFQAKMEGLWDEFTDYNPEGKETFKDAEGKSPFVQKAMAYVKEKGMSAGFEDGTFRPTDPITVKQFTRMMLLSLGYEDGVDFTWNTVGEFAVTAGLLETASLADNSYLTEETIANMMYDTLATNPKGSNNSLGESLGLAVVDTTAPVITLAEMPETTIDKQINVKGSVNETVALEINGEPVDVVENNFDMDIALKLGENKITIEATDMSNNKSTKEITIVREENELKIESVTADSLKMVKLTFNSEIDPASLDKNNFEIAGKTIGSVMVSPTDSKTLYLILAAGSQFDQQSAQTLNYAKKVSDIEGVVMADAANISFTAKDQTVPVIETIAIEKNNNIRVYFSEPVNETDIRNMANYELNGAKLIGVVQEATANTVVISSGTFKTEGENTLKVTNIKDYSGYRVEDTKTFVYTKDERAPQVARVYDATLESVKVQFDEKIDMNNVLASNIKWVFTATQAGKQATSVSKLSDDTIIIYFKGQDNAMPPTGNLQLQFNGIRDLSGNAMPANTKVDVTPVIDNQAPVVTNVSVEQDNNSSTTDNADVNFVINFSKNIVDSDVAPNFADNIEILNSDGNRVGYAKLNLTQAASTNRIDFKVEKMEAGSYTLVIKNLNDDTLSKNALIQSTHAFSIANKVIPEAKAVYFDGTSKNLYVEYSEQMDLESMLNPANYMVKIAGTEQWVTLDKEINGSIAVLRDGSMAVLPMKQANEAYAAVEIFGVKNLAGTAINGYRKLFDGMTDATATKPTIAKSEVTARNKIKVYLSTQVANSYFGEIEIKSDTVNLSNKISNFYTTVEKHEGNNVTVFNYEFTENVFNSKGEILNADNTGSATQVTVAAVVNNTYDEFGNKLTAPLEAIEVADKVGPALVVDATRMVQATKAGETTTVELTFDESLATVDPFGANDIVVTDQNGVTLVPGAEYRVEESTGKLLVTITKDVTSAKIKSASSINFIKDTAGNKASTFDTVNVVITLSN